MEVEKNKNNNKANDLFVFIEELEAI